MSNTTDKGTVLDFTTGQNAWGADVDADLKRFDAWSTTHWAFNPDASSALGYHYYAGPILSAGVPTMIAAGSIILADNSVNYIERTAAGVVSRNAIGFTAGSIPMAKVTTASGLITVNEDWRSPDNYLSPAGRALIDDADAAAQRTTLGLGTAATHAATDFDAAGAAAAVVGLASRATVTKTTASLADNATENGTVTLAKRSSLLSIQADRACRVVFYSTDAARTADASRPLGTPPNPGLGILAEFSFTGASTIDTGPVVELKNGDVSPATDNYYAITNLSGSTHTVTLTLVHLKLEA